MRIPKYHRHRSEPSDEESSESKEPEVIEDRVDEKKILSERKLLVGVDYRHTLDPELVDHSGEKTLQEQRQEINQKLYEAKVKTGAVFYLHTFSGKGTGERTINQVRLWEEECQNTTGGKVFSNLTFRHSVIRNKFGRTGKAQTAYNRNYTVIFDDDVKVVQQSERLGIDSYLVDYFNKNQGYQSLGQALEDYIANYSR